MAHTLHGIRTPQPPAATAPEPLSVLIAEGQGLVRAGFHVLLDRDDGVVVTAEAATSEQAIAAARATRPDVVLMDLELPGLGGVETTLRILQEGRPGQTRVVILMSDDSDEAVFGALRAGATGLLLKDTEPAELVAAVRAVAGGGALLAPALARRVVADVIARPERLHGRPEQLDELTARELEVMALVACGFSNDEIAERLVVTRATAKTHVSRALCKLQVRDRAQLVALAYETGLVRPGARWAEAPKPAATHAVVTTIARAPGGAARRTRLHPIAA